MTNALTIHRNGTVSYADAAGPHHHTRQITSAAWAATIPSERERLIRAAHQAGEAVHLLPDGGVRIGGAGLDGLTTKQARHLLRARHALARAVKGVAA